ncbi:MAG: hypothetical protein RMK29_18425 [Myxococcales bacterium]|nr:hypothetical protein [Myxococcota bacterium]MDW8283685.1 hypothetical protein [Myxococcales bacterium]
MFGSSVLDMAVGLMFFYFLLSTLCATANEWLAGLLHRRSRTLEQAVRRLLGDSAELTARFYAHPLIQSLAPGGRRPSYIPSRTFATVMLDLVGAGGGPPAVCALLEQAGGDGERARQVLARWFDDAMDRVSGSYRRRSQRSILVLSLLVTVAINGDTLALANSLWRESMLRDAFASAAREAGRGLHLSALDLQREVERLRPPLGWRSPLLPPRTQLDPPPGLPWYRDTFVLGWLASKVLGLLLTALAVSLGAPFWFDLLNRISNIRAVGQRPERSA